MDFLTVLSAIISASFCIIKTHFKEMIHKHSESKFVKLNQRGGTGMQHYLWLSLLLVKPIHTWLGEGGRRGNAPAASITSASWTSSTWITAITSPYSFVNVFQPSLPQSDILQGRFAVTWKVPSLRPQLLWILAWAFALRLERFHWCSNLKHTKSQRPCKFLSKPPKCTLFLPLLFACF